ncbi:F-box protein [Musa troglodytarum]|uniref:F-box protein n=1 Tax=Musa troglodytarum TaxID=320322 RepID=A0A9E7KAM6_9LILI|nr:F-box protein [Musa troglodytarum]
MISSLIAVSAQHYLLWSITLEHERLKNLELMDMDGQGVLTTDQWQLEEFRLKPVSTSTSCQQTAVPALSSGASWRVGAEEGNTGGHRAKRGVGEDACHEEDFLSGDEFHMGSEEINLKREGGVLNKSHLIETCRICALGFPKPCHHILRQVNWAG